VDLVPTLVIQSIHQRLPQDVLKNFSHKMISLVFAFDKQSIAAELAADSAATGGGAVAGAAEVDATAAARAACITTCELVIKDAHLAGCTTLSIACSEWTRQTADPVVRKNRHLFTASGEKQAGLNFLRRAFFTVVLAVYGHKRGFERNGEGLRPDVPVLSLHEAAAVRAGLRAVHQHVLQQR
jgi:hypothetical protein